jgi:hypothetical protein
MRKINKELFKDVNTCSMDINKAILDIVNYINLKEKDINDYRQQLQEYNKDKEIQKLQNELDRICSNSVSILSDMEKELAKNFSEKHYKSCKGNMRYIIEGTGIGNVVKVQCTKCDEIEDITDIDSW